MARENKPRRAGTGQQDLTAKARGCAAWARRRELRSQLFAGRYRVPCCFCRRLLKYKEATLEHIRPRSRGGPTTLENLTLSCQPCNSERGNEPFEIFRGRKAQTQHPPP
jgi:5-methylcytosine-specific restriction endonuclease McrA